MKKSDAIEIRDSKALELYEELKYVKNGIEQVLAEVKTGNTIDAMKLAEFVNNFSFNAFLMHGSAYSLNAACALCDRKDWGD